MGYGKPPRNAASRRANAAPRGRPPGSKYLTTSPKQVEGAIRNKMAARKMGMAYCAARSRSGTK